MQPIALILTSKMVHHLYVWIEFVEWYLILQEHNQGPQMYQFEVIPSLLIFEFILIEKKVILILLKLPIEDFVFNLFNNLVIQLLANNYFCHYLEKSLLWLEKILSYALLESPKSRIKNMCFYYMKDCEFQCLDA